VKENQFRERVESRDRGRLHVWLSVICVLAGGGGVRFYFSRGHDMDGLQPLQVTNNMGQVFHFLSTKSESRGTESDCGSER